MRLVRDVIEQAHRCGRERWVCAARHAATTLISHDFSSTPGSAPCQSRLIALSASNSRWPPRMPPRMLAPRHNPPGQHAAQLWNTINSLMRSGHTGRP